MGILELPGFKINKFHQVIDSKVLASFVRATVFSVAEDQIFYSGLPMFGL
jgi:hypothetical protein